jgi:Cytochrome c
VPKTTDDSPTERLRRRSARAIAAGLACALLLASHAMAAEPVSPDVGEAIYQRGVTGAGAPLQALREAGVPMKGTAAACVNCHQRSGLGGREGRSAVPPITGRYLMRPLPNGGGDRDIPIVEGMRGDREPYDDGLIARAIRDGLDSQGRRLSYLMPTYALDDADMAALIDYLKRLDLRRVPGVTDSTLHFATIITPDADPVKRQGMLDVIKQFFAERNVRQMGPAPRMQSSNATSYARTMFMVHRRWELHVWELTGPDSTWQQQLERHLAKEPVLAVMSGLGGSNWAPVHAFCEHSRVPCLFPNVELPVDNERDFYTIYFSKGVLLEAELVARALLDPARGAAPASVTQVYRAGDVGEAAAETLARTLRARGVAVSSQVLPAGGPAALGTGVAGTIRNAAAGDVLVLWLRAKDVAALPGAPAGAGAVYASGLMGGLEQMPLPADWRSRTHLAYPFDLEEHRRVRIDFARGWFAARHIPVVAEQVQADTYLALGLMSEVLKHMVDTFVPDYLIERTVLQIEHRIVTGYYPRLALATGQRFASKGGYIVKWANVAGNRLVPEGDWVIPSS